MRRLRLTLIATLTLAGGLWATGIQAQEAGNPAAPGAAEADLPLSQVVLFTSGVGYYQRDGQVDGDAQLELRFNVEDINDLLKSMVLQDYDGGQITSVTYASREPITHTLGTFAIDLTNNPTLAQILDQMRGERIEIMAPNAIEGTIVGIERQRRPVENDNGDVTETPPAPAPPAPETAPARPAPETTLDVYVVSCGDQASDTAIMEALADRGHTPTLGAAINQFDGSVDLAEFDVLVLLNSYTWSSGAMPDAGQQAVLDFVSSGGGLVTGEWLLYNVSADGTGFAAMMPGDVIGYNSAAQTTYLQGAREPIINNGLPESFDFALGSVAGSEAFVKPRSGAIIFYQSSNSEAAGLLGWDYEQGRVISFSTLLTATELGDPDYERLFVNSVEWAGAAPD